MRPIRERGGRRAALVAGLVGVIALVTVTQADAARVAVVVASPAAVRGHASEGAVGLVVPGAGATVTRAGAVRSLLTGRSISSLAGDTGGTPLIHLSQAPAEVTIYVSLPPPGRHHNVERYPVAVVGAGYRGRLVSPSTRIPGLVSIADIAPTAIAIAQGRDAVIGWRAGSLRDVSALDRRLTRAHGSRPAATIGLAALLGALTLLALMTHSPFAARAALLSAPAAVGAALLLSAAGIRSPLAVGLLVGAGAAALSLAAARSRRLFAPLLALFLVVYAVALARRPEVNALAAIGPHPDGGVRFYGVTNQVETLLLAPLLAAAATSPRWLVAIGTLGLVTLGWSTAGADGGGVLVLLAGLVALALQTSHSALTGARVVRATLAGVALALVFVAVDLLSGGSSHVTRAFGGGPGTIAEDLWRRLHVTWGGATSSWHAALLCLAALAALVLMALRTPRDRAVSALVVALGVSLVVNDSPVDELVWGALGCAALHAWGWTRGGATARSSAPAAPRAPSARSRRPA